MTVEDLRKMLYGLPDDMPVVLDAYEFGMLDMLPESVRVVELRRYANAHHRFQYGVDVERRPIPDEEKVTVQALYFDRWESQPKGLLLADYAGPHEVAKAPE